MGRTPSLAFLLRTVRVEGLGLGFRARGLGSRVWDVGFRFGV